jgi:hypothetical protein
MTDTSLLYAAFDPFIDQSARMQAFCEALGAKSDDERDKACLAIHRLLLWAAQARVSGQLGEMRSWALANVVQWRGDADALFHGLLSAKWLIETDDGLYIEGWDRHAGRAWDKRRTDTDSRRTRRGQAADVRKKNTAQKRAKRALVAATRNNPTCPSDVRRMSYAKDQDQDQEQVKDLKDPLGGGGELNRRAPAGSESGDWMFDEPTAARTEACNPRRGTYETPGGPQGVDPMPKDTLGHLRRPDGIYEVDPGRGEEQAQSALEAAENGPAYNAMRQDRGASAPPLQREPTLCLPPAARSSSLATYQSSTTQLPTRSLRYDAEWTRPRVPDSRSNVPMTFVEIVHVACSVLNLVAEYNMRGSEREALRNLEGACTREDMHKTWRDCIAYCVPKRDKAGMSLFIKMLTKRVCLRVDPPSLEESSMQAEAKFQDVVDEAVRLYNDEKADFAATGGIF